MSAERRSCDIRLPIERLRRPDPDRYRQAQLAEHGVPDDAGLAASLVYR
jgi:hypothetical protein